MRKPSLDVESWKLKFKPDEEPGRFWHGLVVGRWRLLVEHSAHGDTRVREITLDGSKPRRSEPVPGRVLAARACGAELLVLLGEGQLWRFDPQSFSWTSSASVDPLANELTVSPSHAFVYAGATGRMAAQTSVLHLASGHVSTLPWGFPRLALRAPSEPLHHQEWWYAPEPGERRLVRLSQEGAEARAVFEEPALRQLERLHDLSGDGTSLYGVGRDTCDRRDDIPGALPAQRELVRLQVLADGSCQVTARRSCSVYHLVCATPHGVVALEQIGEPGWTGVPLHVRILDPDSLEVRATRTLKKQGPYEHPMLIDGQGVLLLRRKLGHRVDSAWYVHWAGERPQLAVADVRVSL